MNSKTFSGTVTKGEGRAAKLGFPTVNIVLADDSVSGIYAGQVKAGGTTYQAAIFAAPKRKLLEAHLLDFSGDLYGTEVTIELLGKIRESMPFTDDAQLSAMIQEDVRTTRAYFKNHPAR